MLELDSGATATEDDDISPELLCGSESTAEALLCIVGTVAELVTAGSVVSVLSVGVTIGVLGVLSALLVELSDSQLMKIAAVAATNAAKIFVFMGNFLALWFVQSYCCGI